MADDPLRELLTSPLDRPVKAKPLPAGDDDGTGGGGTGGSPGWPWFAASLVIGALIVLVGYLIARDDGTEATTTTTTAPPTTTTTIVEASPFPEGFVAVDDYLAMRVERVLVRSDYTFVTVSSVVSAGLDPDQAPAFSGGLWALVLNDGSRIVSNQEGTDALAQGLVSVVFPTEGFTADDITSIELTGRGNRSSEVVSATAATSVTIPEVTAESGDPDPLTITLDPGEFTVDSGVTVSFSDLTLDPFVGRLDWELTGSDGDALASVLPTLQLVPADGPVETAATRVDTAQFRVFLSFFGSQPMARSGTAYFDPVAGQPQFTAGEDISLQFDLELQWIVFTPASASLPIDPTLITIVQ